MAMNLLHTVSCSLPREVVSLHDARIATTFASADNVDGLDLTKRFDIELLSNLVAVG